MERELGACSDYKGSCVTLAREKTAFKISRREWWVALLISLTAVVLLTAPYLLGHQLARPGTFYTGLLINVEDGAYLSAIEQGRSGAWTYRNFFTFEEHEPVFIQGFYLVLGHLARLLGLSAVAMWHLARAVLNLLLFLTLFAFIGFHLTEPGQRRVAFLLLLFGSGYDLWRFPAWFERTAALDAVPVTLRMPEAHLFYSALTYPHFVAGILLLVAVFWFTFLAVQHEISPGRRWTFAGLAAVANLLLVVVYPFLIFLVTAVLAAYCLYRWWRSPPIWRSPHRWQPAAVLVLIYAAIAPLFFYYYLALSGNEVMQAWNAQAVTLSPNPLHYVLTYLPYLVAALPGLILLRRPDLPRREALIFLWLWLLAAAILLYLPVKPQRRFVQGLQLPLAILATAGLYHVYWPCLRQSRLALALVQRPRYSLDGLQRLATLSFLLAAGLVSGYLLAGAFLTVAVVQPYPLFRPQAELEAMEWLRANSRPEEVVLTAYWTGSYLPYGAGNRTVVGHRYETNQFEERRWEVEQYFGNLTDDEWRRTLLRRYRVAYVFAGPAERGLGRLEPGGAPYLERVFGNDEAAVYRVLLLDE
jgi:hypothetical protein